MIREVLSLGEILLRRKRKGERDPPGAGQGASLKEQKGEHGVKASLGAFISLGPKEPEAMHTETGREYCPPPLTGHLWASDCFSGFSLTFPPFSSSSSSFPIPSPTPQPPPLSPFPPSQTPALPQPRLDPALFSLPLSCCIHPVLFLVTNELKVAIHTH